VVIPAIVRAVVRVAIVAIVVVTLAITMIAAMFIAMFVAIMWNVHFVVPIVLNEVNLAPTGIIPDAIPAPVALMTVRYMQIHRFYDYAWRSAVDDNRPGIDNWRWSNVAKLNLPVKARLSEADRHANVAAKCRIGNRSGGYRHGI